MVWYDRMVSETDPRNEVASRERQAAVAKLRHRSRRSPHPPLLRPDQAPLLRNGPRSRGVGVPQATTEGARTERARRHPPHQGQLPSRVPRRSGRGRLSGGRLVRGVRCPRPRRRHPRTSDRRPHRRTALFQGGSSSTGERDHGRADSCIVRIVPVVLLALAAAAAAQTDGGLPEFTRDVLPILAQRCYACHGPDEAPRKAGLRLDRREGIFRVLEGGDHVVKPGDASASVLYERITDVGEDRMPPPSAGLPLSERETRTLSRWIDGGAPWSRHWAFAAPKRPTPPRTR